jgi:hypothetical protein
MRALPARDYRGREITESGVVAKRLKRLAHEGDTASLLIALPRVTLLLACALSRAYADRRKVVRYEMTRGLMSKIFNMLLEPDDFLVGITIV